MSSSLNSKTKKNEMLNLARLLAQVAEDLAIEILSEYIQEEFEAIRPTAERLEMVASKLIALKIHVPYPVAELLRNSRYNAVIN